MPKIVRNPRIRDNIRIVDYKQYCQAPVERQLELMEWYERGDLLALTNYRFDAGREVLSGVTFPNGTKKLMLHTGESEHGEPPREREWGQVHQILGEDAGKTAQFREAVAAANAELIRLIDGLFPRYNYTKRL